MSLPPLVPEKSTAGIAVDPRTLERVIPESRRPDGSVRKQIKIRPGYTPQEDVQRFRGSRQQAMDARALPKGQIIGWAPPPKKEGEAKALSKSAKKNEKRKEKRKEKQEQKVRESWESDEEPEAKEGKATSKDTEGAGGHTSDTPSRTATDDANAVAEKLEKLKV